jgi:hypothetical protein
MSLAQDHYEYVLQGVDTLLAAEGFRRSVRCFLKRLPAGGLRWSICFQKSRASTAESIKFTAEISAQWKRRPAHYEDYIPRTTWYGGAGNRIGYFMPKKEDTWWDIDGNTSASVLSAQINGVLVSGVLPFLRQFETEQDIVNHLRAASKEMRLNYIHAITMLELDLRENKKRSEIEERISKVRFLGKLNLVSKAVTEATIQRVLQPYESAGISRSQADK